jgi:hypothetical protein
MASLYTKNGRPLTVSGTSVFGPNGNEIGRIRGDKVYGPDGRYVGTITQDRLVHRSTDGASIGPSFAPSYRGMTGEGNRGAIGVWGDEPNVD